MSQVSQLEGLAWSVFMAGAGAVLGNLVDVLGHEALASVQSPVARAGIQFGAGVLLLGEVFRLAIPAQAVSPVGDGLMFYWFFAAQPLMQADVAASFAMLNNAFLKPSAVATATPPQTQQTPQTTTGAAAQGTSYARGSRTYSSSGGPPQ